MKVKIYGKNQESKDLYDKVIITLEELGLSDFINVETTTDNNLKEELKISKEPALIVEEESIDFKDTIFEGMIPTDEELKSMFISIIGGSNGSEGCEPSSCGTCMGC